MEIKEFLEHLSLVKPDKDIIAGRRGSEENVKIKFLVPLLELLGYDRVKDMNFEMLNIDIALAVNYKLILISECKSWDVLITDYLHQCLEYSLKTRTPDILVSSGYQTALYSSLLNPYDLHKTGPIIQFSFRDLLDKRGAGILLKLYELIGKEKLMNGGIELKKEIMSKLPKEVTYEKAFQKFLKESERFKPGVKARRITEEEFIESAKKHPKEVYEAMMILKDAIHGISIQNPKIRIRYRSREIGIEYLLNTGLRPKSLGLFGVYPRDAHIAFGLEGWMELGVSKETLQVLENQQETPRKIKSRGQAKKVIRLLNKAVQEIKYNLA